MTPIDLIYKEEIKKASPDERVASRERWEEKVIVCLLVCFEREDLHIFVKVDPGDDQSQASDCKRRS